MWRTRASSPFGIWQRFLFACCRRLRDPGSGPISSVAPQRIRGCRRQYSINLVAIDKVPDGRVDRALPTTLLPWRTLEPKPERVEVST